MYVFNTDSCARVGTIAHRVVTLVLRISHLLLRIKGADDFIANDVRLNVLKCKVSTLYRDWNFDVTGDRHHGFMRSIGH